MKHRVLFSLLWVGITFSSLSTLLYSVSDYESEAIRTITETHGYPPSQARVASLLARASQATNIHALTEHKWAAGDEAILLHRLDSLTTQRALIDTRAWWAWILITTIPLAALWGEFAYRTRSGSTKTVEPTGYAAHCHDRIDDGHQP